MVDKGSLEGTQNDSGRLFCIMAPLAFYSTLYLEPDEP